MTSYTSSNRARFGHCKAIVDVWRRELGQLSGRSFAHRLAASEDLILKLGIVRKLEKHRGCVNTVSFNAVGDTLVSGSDDRKVILWDWEAGKIKLAFHSGHRGNIFQAKFMPYSGDRDIVTCAADGQVRHAIIRDGGGVEMAVLGSHNGRVHKLAIETGSPHIFYTCGEDGFVQHFDLRTKDSTMLLACRPVGSRRGYRPVIHLNAITIDPRNANLFAVGGTDEYARLYDIRKHWEMWDGPDYNQPVDFFCPHHLVGNQLVEITGLSFSESSELLVSYNNENIYLFDKDMGMGDDPSPSSPSSSDSSQPDHDSSVESCKADMVADEKPCPQAYCGHTNCETVKGVGFCGSHSEYVVSGSDCGRIFIWRKKHGELLRVMKADKHVVNCIESHPHITMLASSGIEDDIKIWTPVAEERAIPPTVEELGSGRRSFYFAIGDDEDEDEEEDDDDFGFIYDNDDEGDESDYDISDDEDDKEDESSDSDEDGDDYEDDDDEDDEDDGSDGDGCPIASNGNP